MQPRHKLAAIQFDPIQGELEANRERSCRLIECAAQADASLIVLPECCTGGIIFDNREAVRAVSETVPGPSTNAWVALSRRSGTWIVAGLSEREGDKLYNAAVIVGPHGELFRHRKLHVCGNEILCFDRGERLTCVETPIGKVGVGICYDLWFPEVARAYAIAGATVIATPANWLGSPRLSDAFDEYGLPQPYHILVATAICNEVVVIAADRVGHEKGTTFLGTSCILDVTGRNLCAPGSCEGEAILIAEMPDVQAVRTLGGSHLARRRASYSIPPS